jgi:hypothetical protein
MKILKYMKLYESYNSQKDLESLVDTIFEFMSEDLYTKHKNKYYAVQVPSIQLDTINTRHYPTLIPFMESYGKLIVMIANDSDIDGYNFENSLGVYYCIENEIDNSEIDRYIFIKENNHTIEYVNEYLLRKKPKDEILALIKYSLTNIYSKTLLHELQHAFDDFRSDGKAFNIRKDSKEDRIRLEYLNNKDGNELKEEERVFIGKKYLEYSNSKHEVDARFTSTVYNTNFYIWDFDKSIKEEKDVLSMVDFKEAYRSFKSNITNYRHLSEEEKKRLGQKFGKFYELEKDFIKMKNDEAVIWKPTRKPD